MPQPTANFDLKMAWVTSSSAKYTINTKNSSPVRGASHSGNNTRFNRNYEGVTWPSNATVDKGIYYVCIAWTPTEINEYNNYELLTTIRIDGALVSKATNYWYNFDSTDELATACSDYASGYLMYFNYPPAPRLRFKVEWYAAFGGEHALGTKEYGIGKRSPCLHPLTKHVAACMHHPALRSYTPRCNLLQNFVSVAARKRRSRARIIFRFNHLLSCICK